MPGLRSRVPALSDLPWPGESLGPGGSPKKVAAGWQPEVMPAQEVWEAEPVVASHVWDPGL